MCQCGKCRTCRSREATRKLRARRKSHFRDLEFVYITSINDYSKTSMLRPDIKRHFPQPQC